MKVYAYVFGFVASLVVASCGHKNENEGHEAEKEPAHGIVFTTKQAQAAGLAVEKVEPGIFRKVIKTGGRIQPALGDEAIVSATSNGIVYFTNRSITEGAAINAGTTIVNISAKKLTGGDSAAKAQIAYETALKEFKRAEELVKDKIVSEKEFEQARSNYETAKTMYDAQASEATGLGVKVTSPISGYIKSRLVNQGEYVSIGQPIAIVSQNRKLQLRAEVSENYFNELKKITGANFAMSYGSKVYQLSGLNGRLVSFGKSSGDSSFYIPITFEFDNIGEIVPGCFAEVYLLSSPENNVISIPLSAITEEQGLYFAYLQVEDEEFVKREITIGQNDGTRVKVLSGLKAGEKVVTKGVYQVKLAGNSSAIPDVHSH
jgi:RND family efflux transporter MFP subunit